MSKAVDCFSIKVATSILVVHGYCKQLRTFGARKKKKGKETLNSVDPCPKIS